MALEASSPCPCGTKRPYSHCCAPLHASEKQAETAEQLMRARYCAYTQHNIDFIIETTWPAQRKKLDHTELLVWAQSTNWLSLEVIECTGGTAEATQGTVLFNAKYLQNGRLETHRELSLFKRKSGQWYFVKPLPEKPTPKK
ncbi:YchJ family protein [Polycladidibacter stylochi]|uniref:YchJ family protein n=1 Tax=Polycladidibacter stylochi TaxID=1807766 RepID=UPI00082F214E|nr:YchJ family protein [Pseudovibrio stylochi]